MAKSSPYAVSAMFPWASNPMSSAPSSSSGGGQIASPNYSTDLTAPFPGLVPGNNQQQPYGPTSPNDPLSFNPLFNGLYGGQQAGAEQPQDEGGYQPYSEPAPSGETTAPAPAPAPAAPSPMDKPDYYPPMMPYGAGVTPVPMGGVPPWWTSMPAPQYDLTLGAPRPIRTPWLGPIFGW